VYAFLKSTASPLWFVNAQKTSVTTDPQSYYVTEGTYERERQKLFAFENTILSTIGFDTHVTLPHTIALTYLQAIYLAARETGAKLADGNWWEVFDVEREDLGFLVLAYSSLAGFGEAERTKWSGRKVPLGIDRSP
jgi:hypothetical protein